MNLSSSIDNNDITRIITYEPTKEAPDLREYSQKLSEIIINWELKRRTKTTTTTTTKEDSISAFC